MLATSKLDGTDDCFDGTRQLPSKRSLNVEKYHRDGTRRAEAKNIESAGFGATLTIYKCLFRPHRA